MTSVFDYTDYRLLLKDLYDERKRKQASFSYRYIGQKAGFSSAGFFTNILKGKRNISQDLIFRFAELFKFTKKETEYFEALVMFSQAKQHGRKRFYYEKMLSMMKSRFHQLAADQYEYFDKWYYVAVREILHFYPFKGDYAALSKMVRPSISPSEAKKAVDLLQRLELIEERADGVYALTNKAVSSGTEVPLVAVHNFQLAGMDLAKEAIDRFPREERTIMSASFSVSEQTYRRIEQRLKDVLQEVREMVKNNPERPDRAYHFNIQCFPLSRPYDHEENGA